MEKPTENIRKPCAISNCYNKPNEKISFHSFPSSKSLWTKWKTFCNMRSDDETSDKVCSDHFTADCFNSEIKSFGALPHTKRTLRPCGKYN